MGGSGSGQWIRWNSKRTTESRYALDIRFMRERGLLQPGSIGTLTWSRQGKQLAAVTYRTESDYTILDYKIREHGNDWEEVQQSIKFDRTPCHYGGHRTWFLCPRCEKRVALSYFAGKYFFCRHCCNLTYTTQKERDAERLMTKAQKIREKLGASLNLSEPILFKPKGMHQKTFDCLRRQADEASNRAFLVMGKRLGLNVDSE